MNESKVLRIQKPLEVETESEVREYPQSFQKVVFNEGNYKKERRCLHCGGSCLVDSILFFPDRTQRKHKIKLSFSFCRKGCLKTYALNQRNVLMVIFVPLLTTLCRTVFRDKKLVYPNVPLYEHQAYQWIPPYPSTLDHWAYITSGEKQFQIYEEEMQEHGFMKEEEIWRHHARTRDTTPPLVREGKQSSITPRKEREEIWKMMQQRELKSLYPEEETLHERMARLTESATAYLCRTKVRESHLLNQNYDLHVFEECYEKTKGLPHWMRWRYIDFLLGQSPAARQSWDWRKWFTEDLPKQSHQTTTLRLWQTYGLYIPWYTDDEWAQILPDATFEKRYFAVLHGKESLMCFVHKAPVQHPFFRSLAFYASMDHLVFDTRQVACSPFCVKTWLCETRDVRYEEELVYLQEVSSRRWNYNFAVQCAPPVSILPPYSNFRVADDILDKYTPSTRAARHEKFEEIYQLEQMCLSNPFRPPQTVQEFELCASLNCTVFQWIFPPFAPQKCFLYPRMTDIYPFGINCSTQDPKYDFSRAS